MTFKAKSPSFRIDADATVLLLSLTLCGAAAHAATPVSVFRGNPEHTGVYEGKAPAGMKLKWFFKTQGKVRSSPAAADGVVCAGSEDGRLYALDAATGKPLWKIQTNGDFSSSPAIAGGVVYAVGGDGHLLAAELKTGAIRWRFETGTHKPYALAPGQPQNWDYYASSPNIGYGAVFFGGGDGYIYAVNLDGKLRWKVPAKEAVRASPALANGTVYAGGMDGVLYAIDAETGKTRWTFKTEGNAFFPRGEIQSSPAVADGTVFFGSRDGQLYAVDAQTGQQKWRYSHKGSWVITSPAVQGGVVFAGSSDGKFVNAVDAKTGEEKWRHKTDGRVFSSPAIADGRIYFGLGEGGLQSLELATGKPGASFMTEIGVQSSPAIANGVVYFGSDDSNIYAVEGPPARERKEAAVDPAVFDAYAGEYEMVENSNIAVRRDGPKLLMKVPDQAEVQLFPASETVFFLKSVDFEAEFVKENGRVARMKIRQGDFNAALKKVK